MNAQPLRYSKEDFARRGNKIYEAQVRPQVEKGNFGKIVVDTLRVSRRQRSAIDVSFHT